jgi:hypothetical protein
LTHPQKAKILEKATAEIRSAKNTLYDYLPVEHNDCRTLASLYLAKAFINDVIFEMTRQRRELWENRGVSESVDSMPRWLVEINLAGGIFTLISTDWDTQGESHAG